MDIYSNMCFFISSHKKRIVCILSSFLLLLIITTYCSIADSEESIDTPTGTLLNYSDCKGLDSSRRTSSFDTSTDCLQFDYSGSGILTLTHINAGFNCCPGQISAEIVIENYIITITEAEEIAGCHCNCLYDIYYQITGLSPGVYTIKVIEPYVAADEEKLEFTVSLTGSHQDVYCVGRNYYPWGI